LPVPPLQYTCFGDFYLRQMGFLQKLLYVSDQNCVNAACRLISILKVRATRTTVKNKLIIHPDYPSLLSISDTLTDIYVKNTSGLVPAAHLDQLPLPFIVQVRVDEKEYFTVVTAISNNSVTCMKVDSDSFQTLKRNDFTALWTGIVMLAETTSLSGEQGYDKERITEKINATAATALIILLTGAWIFTGVSAAVGYGRAAWGPFLFTTLQTMGLITSLFLLVHEVDAHNPLLDKMCKPGKLLNCAAVLGSEGAKPGGILSWSEIGFAYFAGGWLICIWSGMDESLMGLLAWLNVAVLPYVFFSIYYQWRVVRQWCRLCLAVQAILVLECIVSVSGNLYNGQAFHQAATLRWLFAALLPLTGWLLLKGVLLLPKKYTYAQYMLNRFRYDVDVFTASLQKQRTLANDPRGLGITLGAPGAMHRIIKICNPYCGPCAQAHSELEGILENFDNVEVQVIFTATGEEEDKRLAPVKHFLAIAEKGDEALLKQALHDWYSSSKKDYPVFATRYPMNGELQRQLSKVEQMHAWVSANGIQGTPAFFYNGHRLPDTFAIADLNHILHQTIVIL
jgi:uncharacterized membrane protein